MLINGEKYACDACVRGHRVSTCQHHDRPLTHINKKGRPVSQCPHCRGLRKARAAHAACECGSKPHKKEDCVDIDSSKSDLSETYSDTASDPGSEHTPNPPPPPRSTCCCSHGMRCTCALKKEHLDPVSEVDSMYFNRKRATSGPKPRLLKTGSDNALTVFTNGHHKPVHKHNDSAHKSGAPYTIPIPHSVSGNADLARRSTDSLPTLRHSTEHHPHYQGPVAGIKQDMRVSKSEHGSPQVRASLYRGNSGSLPPLELSYPALPPSPTIQYTGGYSQSPRPQEIYYDAPEDSPVGSAGLHATTDWSDLNLPLDNTTYPTGYGQPPSYINLSQTNVGQPQPCLTSRSSSGDISDTASDYLSHTGSHSSPLRTERPPLASPDSRSLNRLSSSSFTSLPQTSLNVTSNNPVSPDTEFHPVTASPIEFEDPSALHADAYERHGFTVHDAQKLAHPDNTKGMDNLSAAFVEDLDQLVWNRDPNPGAFVSQAMVEGIGAGAEGSLWQ